MTNIFKETQQAYKKNEPPIEIDQRWIALGSISEGVRVISRRIRILAPYPNEIDGKRYWIYEEMPGGIFKTDNGRLGLCPEFNLRYVFELEQ